MNRIPTRWLLSVLLALLGLFSCGGEPPDEPGIDLPEDAPCAAGELTLPDGSCQTAGLPPTTACPPGERTLADGSCQTAGIPPEACAAGRFEPDGRGGCAPILPGETCRFGQMAVPGERACRQVSPCGEGPWGNIPLEATAEHVDQGYQGQRSDGSREKPWKTIREGVRAAAPGAIVAVAAGRYREEVVIVNKPVRLWGRCPARVEVTGTGAQGNTITIVREPASGSEVRGLAVTGPITGILVQDARSVVLEDVWIHEAGFVGLSLTDHASATVRGALIERNKTAGVVVDGAEATVEATVVRATQPDRSGQFGRGIHVDPDQRTGAIGKLSLLSSVVEENHEEGVVVEGAEATLEATVVRAAPPEDTGHYGRGIVVQPEVSGGAPGKLSLVASLVAWSREVGVMIIGAEAAIEATVVRATQPGRNGLAGGGIFVQTNPATGEAGRLRLTTSLIEENLDLGVLVEGSEATVEGTMVRATRPSRDGRAAMGINVSPDEMTGAKGKLRLTASRVEENHGAGVYIADSEATVETTAVRATQPDDAWQNGYGLALITDLPTGEVGKLQLTSSLFEENHGVSVLVIGAEATIEATAVRATRPAGADRYGRGINVQPNPTTGQRGKLRLTTSLIEEAHDVGVLVEGSDATVEATVVRATRPNGNGLYGRGIVVQPSLETGAAGALSLLASRIEENHEIGVLIEGSEATVAATIVRATQPNGSGRFGYGVSAQLAHGTRAAGKLSLTDSLIEENHGVGVMIMASEATVEATTVRTTRPPPAGTAFGDGIFVTDVKGPSLLTVSATETTGNTRAGLLYIGSLGELSFVRSSGNRFGLVLQPGESGVQPTLREGNVFERNIERDKLVGGDLPVPDAAPPLP